MERSNTIKVVKIPPFSYFILVSKEMLERKRRHARTVKLHPL